jgi:hypothetical protein
MGPRIWAAIGNILKISAFFGYLAGAVAGYQTFQLNDLGAQNDLVLRAGAVTVAILVFSVIMWNLKGPLVSGNFIVRLIVGVYMLLWVISTAGFGLIFIGIVYMFTGEPASYDLVKKGKPPKSPFKAPRNWQPTGRIGPSGATLYTDAARGAPAGILDSWIPVQIVDKRNGLARVVAATGEGGWIDVRTVTEGA